MAEFFYKYLIKSNLFIAICACSFYLTGIFLLNNSILIPSTDILLVIFLSTFFIYSVSQRPFRWIPIAKKEFSIDRLFLLLALIALIYFSINLPLKLISALILMGLVSILYNAISSKKSYLLPLRSIPLLKVFLISFVWAGVGVVLPMLTAASIDKSRFYVLVFCQIFFILAITLPFDIRDFYKDFKVDLITVPSVIGIKKTKFLAYAFWILHLSGMLFLNPLFIVVYLPFTLLVFFLIKGSSAARPNYYYTFLIDGLILLQFILLYGFALLN